MVRRNLDRRFAHRAAVVLILAVSGCATAPTVAPRWTEAPTPERLGEAFPGFAADAGIEGSARLACIVAFSGVLQNCTVAAETPGGLGFGAAALLVSDRFRADPAARNGVAVPARVTFAVDFGLPPVESVLPWNGPAPDPDALTVARQVVARQRLSLTNGPDAVRMDGLPADRVEEVTRMIAEVQQETGAEMREAHAVNLARTQTLANLRLLTQGQRRPSRPNMSDEEIERSQDLMNAVAQKQNDRLKALYCARYACGQG